MDTNCLISYKINNNWIIVNDINNIPQNIDGLKINNYVFEGFKQIGLIFEVKQNSLGIKTEILWLVIDNKNIYKFENGIYTKIPLIIKNGKD